MEGRGAKGRRGDGCMFSARGWGLSLGAKARTGEMLRRTGLGMMFLAICATAGAVSVNVDGVSVDVTVSSIVGSGAAAPTDGSRAIAGFSSPRGIAAINDSFVVVADRESHRIRMVNSVTGEVTTLAGGNVGFWDDYNGFGLAQFDRPSDVRTISGTSLLVVSDAGNHALRVVDTASHAVWTLAGTRSPGLQAIPPPGPPRPTLLHRCAAVRRNFERRASLSCRGLLPGVYPGRKGAPPAPPLPYLPPALTIRPIN